MQCYRISHKKTGKELGEGNGSTKAEALLYLHRLALLSVDKGGALEDVVELAPDGRHLCFVDDHLREVPAHARYRNILGDVSDVVFERVA
jgi:hypothetical protein